MKNILAGFFSAFSMYSIIPMPKTEWSKDTMKYSLCFFPFVGLLIGFLIKFLFGYIHTLSLSSSFFSFMFLATPLIISGGLHLDGFLDSCDAIYSRQSMERKLEILEDPHIGAFGVMICVIHFLFQLSMWSQVYHTPKYFSIIPFGFVLSRIFASLAVVSFKTAKNTGLAHIFSSNSDKSKVRFFLVIFTFILFLSLLFANQFMGIIVILTLLALFVLFKNLCYKEFGGITGDLSGFFIVTIEDIFLFLAAIGGVIW